MAGHQSYNVHAWQNEAVGGRDLSEGLGHLKGPHSVHVGGNDGNAMVLLFGVAEHKLPLEVDLSRREGEGEGRGGGGGGREEKRENVCFIS